MQAEADRRQAADRKLNNRHAQCSLGSIRLPFGTSEACPYPFSAWIPSEKRGYNAVKGDPTFARRACINSCIFFTSMTLQWTFAAGFLYAEIGVLLLFCLPFISPKR